MSTLTWLIVCEPGILHLSTPSRLDNDPFASRIVTALDRHASAGNTQLLCEERAKSVIRLALVGHSRYPHS
jgi:hypothetical protein